MSERKPLTLEELREIYDASECVGIHVLLQVYSVTGVRGLLDHRDDDGICAVYAANGEWLKEKDYGKTWAAYATEPHRLDRSAWEPCERCRNGNTIIDVPACDQFGLIHNGKSNEQMHFLFQFPFCPHCGRPLTDAAWEMLGKRLEDMIK